MDSSASTSTMPSNFSSESYFRTQSAPHHLDETIARLTSFVKFHTSHHPNRRIVLITSGGTTVPLEHNLVRFLDNFSAGTRGSASAEAFLRTRQYAVIFLHRSHSLQPFSRHYPHSTNPFLNLLTIQNPREEHPGSDPLQEPSRLPADHSSDETTTTTTTPEDHQPPLFPILPTYSEHHPIRSQAPASPSHPSTTHPSISIDPQHHASMLSILRAHHLVHRLNLLHTISFVTVNEYLYLLRAIAKVLGEPSLGLGRRAMLYLAAAVSDFFIPQQKLSEHKIQSGKGSLVIEMDAVPKVLKDVTNEWSNQAFIVSFKLETDPELLIPKAKAALVRYGHHLVIANELHTRKTSVLMIDRDGSIEPIKNDDLAGHEIEEQMVHRLVSRHRDWILQSPNLF